jgi:hypothetical protein
VSASPKRAPQVAPASDKPISVERIHSGVLDAPAAVVGGRAALILSAILKGSLRDELSLRKLLNALALKPEDRAAALDAFTALEAAGESYRQSRRGNHRGNAVTSGNDEPLASEPMVTVSIAARVLNCSERRVRQLAVGGDLDGRKTPRGWVFPRSAVIALRERRTASEAEL